MQDLGRSGTGVKTKRRSQDELDLEVDWSTIQAMSDHADAPGPRPEEEEEEGRQEEGPPAEEGPLQEEEPPAEVRPEYLELPESEEEEEEEEAQAGGRGRGAELEAIRLMDNLHLGNFWPVREGEERRRRPPARLGVEQERGFWEERLPRELSMGEPGSRQITPQPSPQPSPPAANLTQSDAFAFNALPDAYAFNAPGSSDQQLPTDHGYEQLPASRDWDADEIAAMQVDWSQPPRCNLVCFHHFCPEWAGEEEPDLMEEATLHLHTE